MYELLLCICKSLDLSLQTIVFFIELCKYAFSNYLILMYCKVGYVFLSLFLCAQKNEFRSLKNSAVVSTGDFYLQATGIIKTNIYFLINGVGYRIVIH